MTSIYKSVCTFSRWMIFNPSVLSKRFFHGSPTLCKTVSEGIERPSTESKIRWDRMPVPKKPQPDRWTPKRALYGENDYKDLLGDGNYQLKKNVKTGPFWLRGWSGNEFQRLIRKRKLMGRDLGPKASKDLNKRIKYLYKKLNRNLGKGYYRSAMKD
ncbi:large ribosomal subunit protein mL51-like [Amphiura filiformis]|uniref:large ribosomal subunit protein mL51-like n=1 Tax=Amphiura filiformis TaxID=82378 RepID=UPI003B21A543